MTTHSIPSPEVADAISRVIYELSRGHPIREALAAAGLSAHTWSAWLAASRDGRAPAWIAADVATIRKLKG